MLKGISVTLYTRTANGTDEFNKQVWTETAVTIPNCLVAPMSEQEIVETMNLYGKKAVYQIAIPKGDTYDWENCKVSFFGENWRVIGRPIQGIEDNIPLLWNKKVRVESYAD